MQRIDRSCIKLMLVRDCAALQITAFCQLMSTLACHSRLLAMSYSASCVNGHESVVFDITHVTRTA